MYLPVGRILRRWHKIARLALEHLVSGWRRAAEVRREADKLACSAWRKRLLALGLKENDLTLGLNEDQSLFALRGYGPYSRVIAAPSLSRSQAGRMWRIVF